MIRTSLCDLFDIEHPIIQAGMGVGATSASLVAAVSNVGALGSLGASQRSPQEVQRQIELLKDLTQRPFAVNHLVPMLNEESFQLTLAAKPKVISLALGDPGELVHRAHNAGSLVMHQVSTVQQAIQAAGRGVDVIIAQGAEAGGFGGYVATLILVPQVVDAVRPVPVVAAGGIATGRGLAAALILGAQGVNLGTRFLASLEAPISDEWKRAILEAESEDANKVDALAALIPPVPGAYKAAPRALASAFVRRVEEHPELLRESPQSVQQELMTAAQQGTMGALIPFAGQSAGAIKELSPVSEIIRQIVAEAEDALRASGRLLQS